ncbi:MAG: N-acetylmuramoyl-L-alanine amidase [Ginsengibacter sp.]
MKKILCILIVFTSLQVKAQIESPEFFFVRTTDSMPFLKYGLGEDRLGGAKMTYLDSNVVLKVVDSIHDNYKVQLSKYHSAYVEKKHVSPPLHFTPKDQLSGSWSVYGDSLFDYVSMALAEKLPYRSVMKINPSRIEVDIFGVVSNTNWITQLSNTKEIKNAWWEQPEDDVLRVIIELKHEQHWGYSIYYTDKNRLMIRVKRQPEKLKLKNLVIAIDAGHGGAHSGAKGISSNILEKDYTLLIAQELSKELIEQNATVLMTRVQDTTLSMYERISFLNKYNPDMLISIHLNSSSRESARGTSTYYRHIGFRPLSTAILKRMLQLDLEEFGNIGSFNFSLNGPTEYPNCLVEVAFLSNKEDEKMILDPKFHKQTAQKIVAGIKDFLKEL